MSREAVLPAPFAPADQGIGPGTVLRGPELEDLPVITFGAPRATIDADRGAALERSAAPEVDPEERYQQGWEAGHQAALASLDARRDQAAAALSETMAAVDVALARQQAAADELAVELALELTRLLLDRELACLDDPGREAIVRCLSDTPRTVRAVFRLNPDDLAGLQDPDELLAGRSYELAADASLASGDVVVEFGGATIDGTLSAALARVAESLRP